jgi:hypothetical protein
VARAAGRCAGRDREDYLGAAQATLWRQAIIVRRAAVARSIADHYQVVVHVDEKSLRGGIGRSDLPIETVKRLLATAA